MRISFLAQVRSDAKTNVVAEMIGRRMDAKVGMGDTAAILGLAATGAVLAAETSRRDDKGKRKESGRTNSNRYDDDESRRPRREEGRDSTNKIKLQGYHGSAANDDDGVWEDASDDDEGSIGYGPSLRWPSLLPC